MIILLPIVLGLSAYYFNRFIRLNNGFLYFIAIIIASASILYPNEGIFTFINSGLLGLAFILVVMYTGALARGSQIKRQLRSVRREYAILGFIFLTPHAYSNIVETAFESTPIEYFGLISMLLLTPLFLTSFDIIKSKIARSKWIKIHRISYIAYFSIFMHLLIISDKNEAIVYSIIFGVYYFYKSYNYYFKTHKFIKASLLTVLVALCGSIMTLDLNNLTYEPNNILNSNQFADGVYKGSAKGYRGIEVNLEVTIKNNQIVNILIEDCGCTSVSDGGKYLNAAFEMTNEIVTQNRTDIDTIAGATDTSKAINLAVINALEKAILN